MHCQDSISWSQGGSPAGEEHSAHRKGTGLCSLWWVQAIQICCLRSTAQGLHMSGGQAEAHLCNREEASSMLDSPHQVLLTGSQELGPGGHWGSMHYMTLCTLGSLLLLHEGLQRAQVCHDHRMPRVGKGLALTCCITHDACGALAMQSWTVTPMGIEPFIGKKEQSGLSHDAVVPTYSSQSIYS